MGTDWFELQRKIRWDDWLSQLKKKKKKIYTHCEIKASGLNSIQIHDLCDTGAVLNQLSYQANWEPVTLREADLPSCRSALMLRNFDNCSPDTNDEVISFMHTHYLSTWSKFTYLNPFVTTYVAVWHLVFSWRVNDVTTPSEQFCFLLCDRHALSYARHFITNAIGRFYVNRPKRATSQMSRVLSDFSWSCQKDVAPRHCSQTQAALFNTNALSAHMWFRFWPSA